jgi:hypothetical protein
MKRTLANPLLYAVVCLIALAIQGGVRVEAASFGQPGLDGADGLPPNGNGDAGSDGGDAVDVQTFPTLGNAAFALGGAGGNGGNGASPPTPADTGGNGGDGGNGGAATASAITTASSDLSATVGAFATAVGGSGGAGGSAGGPTRRDGAGGRAGATTASGYVGQIGSGPAQVSTNATGGDGGFSDNYIAGNGSDATANNSLVSQGTGFLTLSSTATGGSGGGGNGGTGGGAIITSQLKGGGDALVNFTAHAGDGADGHLIGGSGGNVSISANPDNEPVSIGGALSATIRGYGGGGGSILTVPLPDHSIAGSGGNVTYTGTYGAGKDVVFDTQLYGGGGGGGTNSGGGGDGGDAGYQEGVTTLGNLKITSIVQAGDGTGFPGVQGSPSRPAFGGSALVDGTYHSDGNSNLNFKLRGGKRGVPFTSGTDGATLSKITADAGGDLNFNLDQAGGGHALVDGTLTAFGALQANVSVGGGDGLPTNVDFVSHSIRSSNVVVSASGQGLGGAGGGSPAVVNVSTTSNGDVNAGISVDAGTPQPLEYDPNGVSSGLKGATASGQSGVLSLDGKVVNTLYVAGGDGGPGYLSGGDGADVVLSNAVYGTSSISTSMQQDAVAGGGGASGGIPGQGGHGSSHLEVHDMDAVKLLQLEVDGNGGQRGGSGDTALLASGIAQDVKLRGNAQGGRGLEGAGGDATNVVDGTTTSTSAQGHTLTINGTATGGNSVLGTGGKAVSGSRATDFGAKFGHTTIFDVAKGGDGFNGGSASSGGDASSIADGASVGVNVNAVGGQGRGGFDGNAFATAYANAPGANSQVGVDIRADGRTTGKGEIRVHATGSSGLVTATAISGGRSITNTTPVGSTVDVHLVTSMSTAVDQSIDPSSLNAYASMIANPLSQDVMRALGVNHHLYDDFVVNGGTTIVDLASTRLAYPTDGSGALETFTMSFEQTISSSQLSPLQDLLVGLLPPQVQGSFDSIEFLLTAHGGVPGGSRLIDQTFFNGAAINSYFDHALDLGLLDGSTDLTVKFYFRSHTPGSSFETTMVSGAPNPVPEPATVLLAIMAAAGWSIRRHSVESKSQKLVDV